MSPRINSARLPPVDLAAEDDGGGSLLNPFQAADLVEQLVQLFGRVAAEPGDIVEFAADRAQLLDLPHGGEPAHDVLARAWLSFDAHIGLQPAADQALPQAHAIAGDDLALFQALQARVHGGAGNAQLASEGGDAFARVDLQQGDQLAVNFVEGDGADVGHGGSRHWVRQTICRSTG